MVHPVEVAAQRASLRTRDVQEREFLVWLRSVEKRAILMLKWAIFVTSLTFWLLSHPSYNPPPNSVFVIFMFYFMYNLGESYFFWLSRVSLSQVRVFCLTSYAVDVIFITLLIYLDTHLYPATSGPATDFYVFYFLLILRGFALFRTPRGNLMANTIIAAVFIISLLWQDSSLLTYSSRNSIIRVVFIWLVILMSWFIVEIINRQKDEIMRAREHLIRSENLAILGELAAGVAHEINNPIGIISAYAEFLKKNAPADDPRIDDFDVIQKEARRCENIVSEMLNYARPAGHAKTPSDLRAVNDEVLEFLFRRPTGDEIKVHKEYPEHLPLLHLDVNQVKQALLNIYLNARQAMADTGGVLKVSIRADGERNLVLQRVEDNGSGIDPEDIKKVFDPFFTTRPKGTGLGLSITKRIVESHGGRIGIESVRGRGTAVELLFPYDQTLTV